MEASFGLRIRVLGDPVLRKRSLLVKEVTFHHRDALSQMAQLMYESNGLGLSAPQVGINEMMIVVDIGSGLYKLINPKIVEASGSQVNTEGCLSIPGACIKIKRSQRVKIKAQDNFGKPLNIQAEGLLACVFQHEIDHLKGKLIVDYVSFLEKLKISNPRGRKWQT
ncbi:MAG: peptide deformylase [Candidatus Omnitrophica bacterium CG08_land_8_20_14_0_20_41_16]|uniref:Peptide deformylase n=1 Tax=Candidatus Sherwoodlollariibacterium unditelluris TaxID=1974757 RepID=A0A2G9YIJ3_9BACT|nr:MAG: peptide deformylase [Candidatus Omnitrophica bacterium CG23_combo_of_CG06-09_8_20_14_all_41_10]PIS33671.1 MAG: peptide deformylase [Candidatus Omnitrophica bacterium CG08_land_8_20_14_0_20_41_16]